MTALMIDRRGAVDRDDAIHVQPDGDGWTLTVHIADVPRTLPAGSDADQEARRRGHTRYGATVTRHMLPAPVVAHTALAARARRRSVIVTLHVAADGAVTSIQPARGQLTNAAAMDHAEVAAALGDQAHPHHSTLAHAERCAGALYAHRRAEGALAIYDLTHGWATSEDGQLIRLDAPERTVGYVIVQECMIAANAALAAWAVEHDVPILFRNHTAAAAAPAAADLAADLDAAVLAGAPGQLDAARRRLALVMRAATYDATVRGHYALTLPAYTHATSPLRRYADVATLRQILAALDGQALPYTAEDLQQLADELNRAAAEQRESKAAALKNRAHSAARAAAAGDSFNDLPPARFTAIVKRATKEDLHTAALEEEIRRRAAAGTLATVDVSHVLATTNATWRPLRQALVDQVAAEPHQAPTLLAMHAVRHSLPGVEYTSELVPGLAFAARATWNGTTAGLRAAATKKSAQQLAAVSLLAAVAGVTDPTVGPATATSTDNGGAQQGTVAHPVSRLNELVQVGQIGDLVWGVDQVGAPHAPVFRVSVQASVPGRGELRAEGQAGSKSGGGSMPLERCYGCWRKRIRRIRNGRCNCHGPCRVGEVWRGGALRACGGFRSRGNSPRACGAHRVGVAGSCE